MWEPIDKFDAPMCSTEACNQMGVAAAVRFERGGVGSYYCPDCARRIERMRVTADVSNREIDELEAIFGPMEPLGAEFERVWDQNIDKLYEA